NQLTAAQAIVPSSAKIIQNRVGTAPIMWFEQYPDKVLVAMPGVPFETQEMFSSEAFPALLKKYNDLTYVCHHTLIVTDITESDLATRLTSWETSLPDNFHLAYLPNPGYIKLRLDGVGSDINYTESKLNQLTTELKSLCGNELLYDGDKDLAEILLEKLISHNLTAGTAESCTGGNIAHMITLISGSSAAMNGGIIAYSNKVKTKLLNVDELTLQEHGAVSEPVVNLMVKGTQELLNCDVALATSGIAGPTGGTPEKPVGTVCIAVACKNLKKSHTYHFPGDRQRVINRATNTAMIMAIRMIDIHCDNK
ncbi:MAG: nicotinamide-nucleotide amidohydrolase family protein, partial [Paramuribaculum sp.]|nr:nicotinamide-nucleotide amidohydrolase family protein [Paramuribaculum sp.]